ncbi:MAG: hypothetical protein RR902_00450, partial [Oscillospiraceae bacterium]
MHDKITIITVANDLEVLNNCLLKSIKEQTFKDIELLIVDNTNNQFSSMYSAVQGQTEKITGKYVMLVHPDIIFPNPDTLLNIYNTCKEYIPEYAILGAAGAVARKIRLDVSNSLIGENLNYPGGKPINEVTKCFSLDECLVILSTDTYKKYGLDDLGDTWHFYMIDLCCRLNIDNEKCGVFPEQTLHASIAKPLNNSYYETAKFITEKYKNIFPLIYTPCGVWPDTPQKPEIHTCKICGVTDNMDIYELSNFKKRSYNNEYEYFKCNSCGCLQQCQINDIPHSLSSTSNTAGKTYLKTGFSTEKNPLNILLQIKKDLPKNGEYCITVPILDSLGYRIYKENWFGCDAPRNVFIYTKKSMKILCAAAGLSIKKVIFEKTSDSGFYKLSNDITPG